MSKKRVLRPAWVRHCLQSLPDGGLTCHQMAWHQVKVRSLCHPCAEMQRQLWSSNPCYLVHPLGWYKRDGMVSCYLNHSYCGFLLGVFGLRGMLCPGAFEQSDVKHLHKQGRLAALYTLVYGVAADKTQHHREVTQAQDAHTPIEHRETAIGVR